VQTSCALALERHLLSVATDPSLASKWQLPPCSSKTGLKSLHKSDIVKSHGHEGLADVDKIDRMNDKKRIILDNLQIKE